MHIAQNTAVFANFQPKKPKNRSFSRSFYGYFVAYLQKESERTVYPKRQPAHVRTRIYNKKEGNRHSDFFLILTTKDNNALPLNGISGYR